MRLGFHYHIPAISKTDGIYMPGYQGRFIDSLANYCEEVTCFLHSPMPGERGLMDYRLTAPNVTLVDIGPHASVPQRLFKARRFTQPLRSWHNRLDAMLLRGPSPLLPAMAQAAPDVPLALLLVGDYLAGVNDLPQPPWRREAIRLFAWWNYRQQLHIARRSLTMVNSRLLYEQLRPLVSELHEIRTTTLTTADFFVREDTCPAPPYHLLYTGRMDRAKGLFEMVGALALLVSQGEDVILDLVGWPAENDSIIDELTVLAESKGVADRVRYHGYKKVGPELFEFYQQADIYILASRSSEGFPRSLWEAMAHSLPVIATKVGSIPYFISGAAELVEPNNISSIADSLQMILHDGNRRRGLIQAGLNLARENTLEVQAQKLIDNIRTWLDKYHGKTI
ncbi:MAG: glycosyltransferase [Desulfobacca sp.]|nr:glycosyltransferase [Desulfobacca sp.]